MHGDRAMVDRLARTYGPLIVAFVAVGVSSLHGHGKEDQRPRLISIGSMSQDVEVLYGDPDAAGEPFVIRIRELAGGVIPPHRHPVDEHITVVQGRIFFAISDKCERAEMKELKTGSYAFIPKGSTMCGYTPDAAIVQVHGVGPFHIHWRAGNDWRDSLTTLDSPDAASTFKFRKGQRVVTPRGKGHVRQGYDSGEFIGYEIVGDDGSLFMAVESETLADSADNSK